MARYEHADIEFDVPRDWEDRSVVAFSAPAQAGQTTMPNFVMSRDSLASAKDLRQYADRQLIEIAKRLDGFVLIERRDRRLGDVPAVEIRFQWSGESGALQQRLVMAANAKRTVFNLTATAAKDEAAKHDATFELILDSVELNPARSPRKTRAR